MEKERMIRDSMIAPGSFIESNLLDYIQKGYNLSYVSRLVDRGTLIPNASFSSGQSQQGKSYLGVCIANDRTDLSCKFLEKGANPNLLELDINTHNNKEIIDYESQKFNVEKYVKIIRERKPYSNFRLFSPLFLSVEKADDNVFENLLNKQANVEMGLFYAKGTPLSPILTEHLSPLGLAVLYKDERMVKKLLDNGANPWNGLTSIDAKKPQISHISPLEIANHLKVNKISSLIQNHIQSKGLEFDGKLHADFLNNIFFDGTQNGKNVYMKRFRPVLEKKNSFTFKPLKRENQLPYFGM